MTNNIDNFYCQKVIPLVYDNSLSYYELLSKVVDYINNNVTDYGDILTTNATQNIDIQELKTQTNYLESELKKVIAGDYVSAYINSLKNYIKLNLSELIGDAITIVNFGLVNGRFYADIPDSWNSVDFDTIQDINSSDYGKLVIEY